METSIVKTEGTKAVTIGAHAQASGALNSDILIPKVLLMQGLSDYVAERKAQQGDMVRSTTAEKLGDPDKGVEFIPLMLRNEWRLEEKVNGKFEYRGTEPRTAKNEDLEWQFTQNGAEWRRVKVISCFSLLPSDIEAEASEIKKCQENGEMPDLNKTLLPVVVSFRSTSYNAGKQVATHFAKATAMAKYGVKPHGFSLYLSCRQDKNDKGTYYVYDVKQGNRVSKEALDKADEWVQVLSTTQVRVDEASEIEVATEASGVAQARF